MSQAVSKPTKRHGIYLDTDTFYAMHGQSDGFAASVMIQLLSDRWILAHEWIFGNYRTPQPEEDEDEASSVSDEEDDTDEYG